jgi:hypothetical protein
MAAAAQVSVAQPRPVGPEHVELTELPALALGPAGHRFIAYFSLAQRLLLRDLDGGPVQTLYETPRGPNRPSQAGLLADATRLHVLVRPKLGGAKSVQVRTSKDGGKSFAPPVRLDHAGAPLPPIHFAKGDGGLVAAMWVDERKASEKAYEYYVSASGDGGETFPAQEALVSSDYLVGSTSALLLQGREIWAFFTGYREHRGRIVAMRSGDLGKTWQEGQVAELGPGEGGGPMTAAALPGGKVGLFWATAASGIRGAVTQDGKTWAPLALPEETRAFDIGSLEVVAGPAGQLTVAFFGRRDGQPRTRVQSIHSPDGGGRWEPMTSPSTNRHAGLTHAIAPRMAAREDGTVAIVWQDFRDIRPNIYLNYSRDFGRSWQLEEVALDQPGRFNDSYPQILAGADGRYTVAFFRDDDDRKSRGKLYVTEVSLPPAAVKAEPDEAARLARLRARVEDFWQGMIKSEWNRLYDAFDPWFRARITRQGYASSRGGFIYHEASLADVDVKGNIADVKVRVSVEMPEIEIFGKRVGMPRHERVLEERWLWVVDNWYRQFSDEKGEGMTPY